MAINMSYCRFENTLAALRECDEAMAESVNPLDELSESERKAAKRLLKLCREMADNYGDDEYQSDIQAAAGGLDRSLAELSRQHVG